MRYYISLLLFLFGFQVISAQNTKDIYGERLDSLLEEVFYNDDELSSLINPSKNYQFIYSRLSFENQTYFSGRDIGIDQYNLTGQLAYFHSCGINLSVSGAWYSEFDPKYTATSISAGYSKKFNFLKDFRFRVSYDRYFYPKYDPLNQDFYKSGLNIGTTYRKKWGGSRMDGSVLMGDNQGAQIIWGIFGNITLFRFSLLNKIEFEPEVSLFWGNEEVIYTKIGTITGPFGRTRPVINFINEDKFGLLNTEFKVPLTLTLGDFDIELGYNINLPRSLDPEYSYDTSGYFNFSIGYIIDLK